MRVWKFLLAILFVSLSWISATATTITVASTTVNNVQYGTSQVLTMRVYADARGKQGFTTSDGTWIIAGGVGTQNSYKIIQCTIVGTTVTIPSFTIDSTTDSIDEPNAVYTFVFYYGTSQKDYWAVEYVIPAGPTNTTWLALRTYNKRKQLINPPTYYLNVVQVQALIDSALGTLNDASTTLKGRTKLDTTPVSATNPIAVGSNSAKVTHRLFAGDYASFAAALSAAGSTVTTLNVATQLSVTTSSTVPATVTLEFTNTGALNVSSGQVININGPVIASPNSRIFYGSGKVNFRSNVAQKDLWINWWGVTCDQSADSGASILMAYKSAFQSKNLHLTPGCQTIATSTISWDGSDVNGNYGGNGVNLIGDPAYHASSMGSLPTVSYKGTGGPPTSTEHPLFLFDSVPGGMITGIGMDACDPTGHTACASAWIQFRTSGGTGGGGEGDWVLERNTYSNYNVAKIMTDAVGNSTTTVTSATGAFNSTDVGRPVTFNNGLANYYSEIVSINSSTSVELREALPVSATGATFVVYTNLRNFKGIYIAGSESSTTPTSANNENIKIRHSQFTISQSGDANSFKRGVGVYIGNNQNARNIILDNNWFNYGTSALEAHSGNFNAHDNYGTQNTIAFYVPQLSLSARIANNNFEGDRQFLLFNGGAPLYVEGNHFASGLVSAVGYVALDFVRYPAIQCTTNSTVQINLKSNVFAFIGLSSTNPYVQVFGGCGSGIIISDGNYYPTGELSRLGATGLSYFHSRGDVFENASLPFEFSFSPSNGSEVTLQSANLNGLEDVNALSVDTTAGLNTVTTNGTSISASDIGKKMWLKDAGPPLVFTNTGDASLDGKYAPFYATITGYTAGAPNVITLDRNVPSTRSGVLVGVGDAATAYIKVDAGTRPNDHNRLIIGPDGNAARMVLRGWGIESETQIGSKIYNIGTSGATKTIDFNNSNLQSITLTANCTFTFSNPLAGFTYVLEIIQDGTGSRLVTWPAAVKWSGGVAPTLTTTATKTDVCTFRYDGVSYFGKCDLNY